MANIPSELKYTKEHEWIRNNGDGTATVGITDFAQGELGDIVFVDISTVGDHVNQDDSFGTVEAVKTVSELYMPVSGKITEFNDALENDPELVNNDPYGDGWLVKIEMSDPSQFDQLLDSEAYQLIIA
jgi:glycine cleavage system H protein